MRCGAPLQAGVLGARLAATEKALTEANARVTELNSRLALAETDARLKVGVEVLVVVVWV
jgi:hypothetical protein